MRRLVLVLTAAAALAAPLAAIAAGGGTVQVTQAAGARFPDRIFTLSLPRKMALTADRVHVTENGKPVADVAVARAGAGGKSDFGVVLAIDASNSMKGKPIAGALDAARSFLGERALNQQVAILFFNRTNRIVVPFTTDDVALEEGLSKNVRLLEGTRIYDGVQASLDLIKNANIASGSIVVLSDGADTGSRATRNGTVKQAGDAHVRIFTIGLRSGQFSPTALQGLATATGGDYAEAGGAVGLSRIYSTLGSRFAREYLLHYKSLAGPGTKINLKVTIGGVSGTATSTYKTPPLPLEAPPPFHQSGFDKALKSPAAAVLVAVFASILVAFGVMALVRPSGAGVRRRVGEFVSLTNARDGSGSGLQDRVFVGAERALGRTSWWARFKELVELSEVRMPAVQMALWALVGAILVGWLAASFVGSPLAAAFGLLVPFGVYELISWKVGRKRAAFAEQLPDNLQVLASALRAGHSLVGAMSVVVEDSSEPTKSEFRRVVADERLGVPLEDALDVVVQRMASRELAQVSLVAALQRRTGGNSAEVLDRVVELIRERMELRRLVKTLTAQGRMSRWILTALPVGLLAVISLANPTYLNPLFHTGGGRVALAISAGMIVLGSLAIRKIVNIKV